MIGTRSDGRTFLRGMLPVLALAGSLACTSPPEPTSEAVRQAFEGRRAVQPSLSGFGDPVECPLSPGFIPRTVCGDKAAEIIELESLDRLHAAFEKQIVTEPTRDALHGFALLRLAEGPESLGELYQAIADLGQALGAADEPTVRAELLTDLAAANLLLAEELQSAVEVGAAFEAALEAVALDPSSPEARFNQRLARLLLGLDHADDVADDPELAALAPFVRASEPEEAPAAGADRWALCLDAKELRVALDAWVARPDDATWSPLAEQIECLATFPDRFFPDLLAAAEREPERLAAGWRHYQALEAAAIGSDLESLQRHLDALRAETATEAVPQTVRAAAGYYEAWAPFQEGNYALAETILERYGAELEPKGYLGLRVKTLFFLSHISQLRGEHGAALARLDQAMALNRGLGIVLLDAKLAEKRSELERLAGREYDAWRSQVLALRGLDRSPIREPVVASLGLLAEMARRRGFEHMALVLLDHAIEVAEGAGPAARIAARRARGETLARLGRREEARRDLAAARTVLAAGPDDLLGRPSLAADLDYLEGLAAEDPATRRAALERTLEQYREVGYDLRVLGVHHALAAAQEQAGDPEAAIATLAGAFDELEEQVAATTLWNDATGLVAAARPVADALVGLELDHRGPEAAHATIARYLALRSRPEDPASLVGPVEGVRLTTFIRADEVLVLLETDGSLELFRRPMPRDRLASLREQWLLRARARAPESRFDAALEPLAELLLEPLENPLAPLQIPGSKGVASTGSADVPPTGSAQVSPTGSAGVSPAPTPENPLAPLGDLTVVADDVLAGLPFHLLPFGGEGERVLDHWVVRYATDLRSRAPASTPSRPLVLGAAGAGSGLPTLRQAESEARNVAALYPAGHLLLGADANPPAVRSWLAGEGSGTTRPESPIFDSLHVASHFEADLRWPLESTLVLEPPDPGTADSLRRLSLRELLALAPEGIDLLYLSACDTGRGIPTEAHGLHSLAQAFTSSGIRRTVLTLWPLDDTMGATIAKRFYQLLSEENDPARALRRAQLEHRDGHPVDWGALVVVE